MSIAAVIFTKLVVAVAFGACGAVLSSRSSEAGLIFFIALIVGVFGLVVL